MAIALTTTTAIVAVAPGALEDDKVGVWLVLLMMKKQQLSGGISHGQFS